MKEKRKRKIIKKLEALIDAVTQSKTVVAHNRAETEFLIDRQIDYQLEYKRLTGHYYHLH